MKARIPFKHSFPSLKESSPEETSLKETSLMEIAASLSRGSGAKRAVIVIFLVICAALFAGCSASNQPQDTGAPAAGATQGGGASAPAPGVSQPGAGAASQTPGSDQPAQGSELPEQSGEQDAPPIQYKGFTFEVRGLTIEMGGQAAPVIAALGEPINYFEAPSCAFDGIDRIYCYSGFELYTYPVGDEDFISSIILTDDSVTTSKGVYLGMSLDDITGIYGEDFEQEFGLYTYSLDDSSLSFLIEGNTLTSITYNYTNLPN